MTLYHGTRKPFGKGGLVLPGAATGQDNTTGSEHFSSVLPYAAAKVYVTTDLDLAKAFAHLAQGRGKAKVFSVLFTGDIEQDDATYDGEDRDDCFKVDEARIVERVWVEP